MRHHVTDAPDSARRLVKSIGFYRRKITEHSRAEEAGEPDATEARELVTAKFAREEVCKLAMADSELMAAVHVEIAKKEAGQVRESDKNQLAQVSAAKPIQTDDGPETLRERGVSAF